VACRQNDSKFEFNLKKFCENLFFDLDNNKDGTISLKEFKEANTILPGVLKLFKNNHTGKISKKEFQNLFQSKLKFTDREMELFVRKYFKVSTHIRDCLILQ